jgi:DNA-binding HxlR family transcriptional regulator
VPVKKINTERLRRLAAQGLIDREVVNLSLVSVTDTITAFGKTALDCLDDYLSGVKGCRTV